MVYFKTNLGNFTVELYEKEAPVTVNNFLHYVDHKFYNGLIFHRIIDGFMIQGGGFSPDMVQKSPSPPIENEATNGLKNLKYTIAMARTGVVNSATSQFFINVQDNPALDHKDTSQRGFGYCVFGKVVEGMDVIDKIKVVKTTTKGSYGDVPVKPVIIKSVTKIASEEG
ncbi:MAG: peptidyl-prolyl cis-trans isomerase [Candidatus Krumholzibacteriota bacterium]|nr:peptidyl-prolyl cis-trans isomerase [Candidatus Krumholzibacteriota bacterium]